MIALFSNERLRGQGQNAYSEIHGEQLPLAADPVVEADGGNQVPDQTEADAVAARQPSNRVQN